jgi:hypothetical protein
MTGGGLSRGEGGQRRHGHVGKGNGEGGDLMHGGGAMLAGDSGKGVRGGDERNPLVLEGERCA